MIKNQQSIRGGIEDFLCPFQDMYITQGSNSNYSHKGIMANDVRGKKQGIKYDYYAPCTCKCLKTYSSSGQVMWQSVNKVRFANGRIDYATFMTAHDDTMNAQIGQIVKQGEKLGNMGTKGNATGVHCHIEVSQSNDTTWKKNQYGNYHFNNEYDLDDCYFVNNTNILNGHGGNWKTTDKIKAQENKKYINIPPTIEARNIYNSSKERIGQIKPKKFGGLSYLIYKIDNNYVQIKTDTYGMCYVKKTSTTPITTNSYSYNAGNK